MSAVKGKTELSPERSCSVLDFAREPPIIYQVRPFPHATGAQAKTPQETIMWTRLRYWLNDIHLRDPIEQQQAPSLQIFMLLVTIAAILWIALPLYTAGT